MRYSLLVFLCLLVIACKNTPPAPPAPSAAPAAPKIAASALPSISNEMMQNLWNNCTYVDYTFKTLPISMSFDNQPAIQRILSHLEPIPVALNTDCKPTGRAYFQNNGEDLAIAEFYLHTNCRCMVFLKDGKPAYSNRIKDEGMAFYQNSIRQATGQMQGK